MFIYISMKVRIRQKFEKKTQLQMFCFVSLCDFSK